MSELMVSTAFSAKYLANTEPVLCLTWQNSGLAAVLEKFLVKISDAKVLILSTFDGVELMTGATIVRFVVM